MDGRFSKLPADTDVWRNLLAGVVFFVASVGIVVLAIIIVWYEENFEFQKEIFSIVVPVLSTWVGTLLAFYFAKENFETANRNVQQLVSQLSPEQRLQQTNVRGAMISYADMTAEQANNKAIKLGANGDAGVLVSTILAQIGSGASRILILAADGSAKYVLHEGRVYSALHKAFLAPAGGDMSAMGRAGRDKATLIDLLAEKIDENGKSVLVSDLAKRFAFVRIDANMAEARLAMLAIDGARDVFVTASAKAGEPVQGWLTNTIITRDLTVN